MEWIKWNTPPYETGKDNPIWVYSKKNNNMTLGYYSSGVFTKGYFDLNGNGISCAFWSKLQPPEPPKN